MDKMVLLLVSTLLCALLGASLVSASSCHDPFTSGFPLQPITSAYRSLNGSGNNPRNPNLGAAGASFLRRQPYTRPNSQLPSAHTLASAFANVQPSPATPGSSGAPTISLLNLFIGYWLAHDIAGSAKVGSPCPMTPDGSGKSQCSPPPVFPPLALGPNSAAGLPSFNNLRSAFVDCSHFYGTSANESSVIRSFKSGMLKHGYVDTFPPLPNVSYPLATHFDFTGTLYENGGYMLGDSALQSVFPGQLLSVLFLTDHNLKAASLAAANPTWDDELIFQETRRYIIATWQKIVFYDFLPALLQRDLPRYQGYNSSIDPGIDLFVFTSAMRFGHTMSPAFGPNMEPGNKGTRNPLPLLMKPTQAPTNYYFSVYITDVLLRSLIGGTPETFDTFINQNVVNPVSGQPLINTAVFDVLRGRDVGIASYNTLRAYYKLPVATTIDSTFFEAQSVPLLISLYGNNPNLIEAHVGALAELKAPGSQLGPLTVAALTEQFVRLRDGDRFYFESATSGSSCKDIQTIMSRTLNQFLITNSYVAFLPQHVLAAPPSNIQSILNPPGVPIYDFSKEL